MRALGKRLADSSRELLQTWPECRSLAAEKCGEWPPQVLLLANAEFLDYVLIALGIVVLEVIEQATTLAHHHQETAAGGVILLVRFEVFRQFADSFAKHRNLDFRTTCILFVSAEPGNDVLFTLSG